MDSPAGFDEGEIIESDTEKATTSLTSVNGTSIDRHSRTPVSASHHLYRRQPHSPPAHEVKRGEKRLRDDDYDDDHGRADPRHFRVHYEGRDHAQRRQPRVSYADIDRGDPVDSRSRHDDWDSKDRYHKRSRTRSRSPARRSRHGDPRGRNASGNRDDRRQTLPRDRRGENGYEGSKSGRGHTESVSGHSHGPASSAQSSHETETQLKPARRNEANSHKDQSVRNSTGEFDALSADTHIPEGAPEAPAMDEATLIEERRKRREAIKAKYRGSATPLLVQALQLGNQSGPPSPSTSISKLDDSEQRSSRSTSPKISPPNTPKETENDSPAAFAVTKDQDLAEDTNNPATEADQDGPSAADYDPTIDMREDRMRNDHRQHSDQISSAAYDETKAADQEILLPASPAKENRTTKASGDDFDMFADDDDDMFAEKTTRSNSPRADADTVYKAVAVPQAKELDMSMLDNWDDHEGYYRVILGELLDGRYHVQTNLGKGMFSGVVRAMDSKTKTLVAIKLIRNNETMRRAGMKEIEILQKLAQADPEDKKHMIRLERHFDHKGHLCMVFENLSINLREVLKKFGRDVGINLKAVRAYAQQMFLGLSLLRKCNILHADLKPDNVLVNETRNLLKICDLGSASDALENEITPYLVSRFYRAPEIILGIPYDFAIDVWSVGCTLYELYTGKILFTGRTNNQMLRSIMECRGKFGHKMLRRAQFTELHFDDLLNFRSVEKDKLTGKDVVRTLNLTKPTRDLKARLLSTAKGMDEAEVRDLSLFADLLDRCLGLNPEKRCTPTEALRHPFISRVKT